MAHALPLPPPGFDELPVEDKIDYVQALWDRIAARQEDVPVPEWHREILRERVAAFEANPDEGRPWEEVEADLLKRLDDQRR
jgi:putative addiction module component (TIGR02574 family)